MPTEQSEHGRTETSRRAGFVLWGLLLLGLCLRLGLLLGDTKQRRDLLASGGSVAAELVRTLFITLSVGFVVYAYAVRSPPKVHASGWRERYFPMLIAALGFGFFLFHAPPPSPALYLTGMAICIVGWIVTLWGFSHLRHRFSIMAEARELVRTGPYAYVRHPVYFGEMINWIGLAVLYLGWPVALYTAMLILLQALRARVEDQKLAAAFGMDYDRYRTRTGFLFPRLTRPAADTR